MMVATGVEQHDRCDSSPKRAQCDADYVKLHNMAFTTIGAEVMYEEAIRRNDSAAIKFLYPQYDKAFKELKRVDQELKERYPAKPK